jgi:hypothetical protein
LADLEERVWQLYKEGDTVPQYVVFDQDMSIRYKGEGPDGKRDSEQTVEELLR